MMHDVKMGRRVRKSFSKVNEVLSMPDLIEVQTCPISLRCRRIPTTAF